MYKKEGTVINHYQPLSTMEYLVDLQLSCSINEQTLVNEMTVLYQYHPIVYDYIIRGLHKNNVRKTLGISCNTLNILKNKVKPCITDIINYKRSALIKTIIDLINEDMN